MVELNSINSRASLQVYIRSKDIKKKDGSISPQEDPKIKEQLTKFDKNGNGTLEENELMLFANANNHRGIFSQEEIKSAVTNSPEKTLDDIRKGSFGSLDKISRYRLLLASSTDKNFRAKILYEIYKESALFMNQIGNERHLLIKLAHKKLSKKEEAEIDALPQKERSQRINQFNQNETKLKADIKQKLSFLLANEIKFMQEFSGVLATLGEQEKKETTKDILSKLCQQVASGGDNKIKYGLLYLKGRTAFSQEIIRSNYDLKSVIDGSRNQGKNLKANLLRFGLNSESKISNALIEIDRIDAEIQSVTKNALGLEKQIKEAKGLSLNEKTELKKELKEMENKLSMLENSKRKHFETITIRIRDYLQKTVNIEDACKEVLLSSIDFRNQDQNYIGQMRNNFKQGYQMVKGLQWSYFGKVNSEGKLIGTGGISCLGFVEYIAQALKGGQGTSVDQEDIKAQADLLAGRNNDCPYPILTDIHSSVNPSALLKYLSTTGNYFAVQTYSPLKVALHSAIIFVDRSSGQPRLVVAESTSLGKKGGPSIKSYESWAKKENIQANGKGVYYSLTIIDPNKTPDSFAQSPMGNKPIRPAKPIKVASKV